MQAHDGPAVGLALAGEHIETLGGLGDAPVEQRSLGHARQVGLFVLGHAVFGLGGSLAVVAARFYLNENEQGAVIADEIEFTSHTGQGAVARDPDAATPAEIPLSTLFFKYSNV